LMAGEVSQTFHLLFTNHHSKAEQVGLKRVR
jgi:hypothetical protein